MEVALVGLVGTLAGVFMGALINHVFAWKVKGYADALDYIYQQLKQVDKLYGACSYLRADSYVVDNGVVDPNYELKKREIRKEFYDIAYTLNLYDSIIDNKFNNQINCYINAAGNGIDNEWTLNEYANYQLEYQQAGSFFSEVLKFRKDVTSLPYMLKQLFINWYVLVTILLIVIGFLLFH